MKHTENIEKIIEKSYLKNLNVPACTEMDEKILDNALSVMEESKKYKSVLAGPNIGRFIIKSRMTKIAVAAVIIIAVMLLISVLDKSVTPVYAVEQTIAAIKEVKTVYMTGEFYKQGEFECWMKFAGNPHAYVARQRRFEYVEDMQP
ncbi:MAG: hypothetical protein ACYS80_00245 [Planctomycetota bacterium]|jgi:hypothetical protein